MQYLSAKLGVVTGRSLPELVGHRLGTPSRLALWLQAETVAMATDLAEVIGGAVALYLLFDVPLFLGGLIAGLISLLLLWVQDPRGQRPFERVITGLLLIITVGFIAGLFVAPPDRRRSPPASSHASTDSTRCCWPPRCSARPSCRTSSTCIRR